MKVAFPADYPFTALRVTMLTKMFHPNIDGGGRVAYPGDGDVVRDPGKKADIRLPFLVLGAGGDRCARACNDSACRNAGHDSRLPIQGRFFARHYTSLY